MIKWLFLVYGILFSIPAFWSIFFLREQMLLPFSILAGVNFVVFAIMHAAQHGVQRIGFKPCQNCGAESEETHHRECPNNPANR